MDELLDEVVPPEGLVVVWPLDEVVAWGGAPVPGSEPRPPGAPSTSPRLSAAPPSNPLISRPPAEPCGAAGVAVAVVEVIAVAPGALVAVLDGSVVGLGLVVVTAAVVVDGMPEPGALGTTVVAPPGAAGMFEERTEPPSAAFPFTATEA
ncbi:MAG: hypothetical protein P4L84_24500 [Isosphaeraceae bacterium]|nr:hypothetical protein [Isosphaeraceae bacterium]